MRDVVSPLFPSKRAAERWLKGWQHGGKMHSPMWKTVPGGKAVRKLFVCNAHVGCKVGATVSKLDGSWVVKADLSEQHSSEDNLNSRKNSQFTQAQREAA